MTSDDNRHRIAGPLAVWTLTLFAGLSAGCSASNTCNEIAPESTGNACSSQRTLSIRWIDDPPLERTYARFGRPALAADATGFLLVSTERRPDGCGAGPCVSLERLGTTGTSLARQLVKFDRPSEQLRLFAGSDPLGKAMFAAANQASSPVSGQGWTSDEVLFGTFETDFYGSPSLHVERLGLDRAAGLATIGFGPGQEVTGAVPLRPWLVSHAWRPENTVGEGFSFPVVPVIERVEIDGSRSPGPNLDPTQGDYFSYAQLLFTSSTPWLMLVPIFRSRPIVSSGGVSGAVFGQTYSSAVCAAASDTRDADSQRPSLIVACADTESDRLYIARTYSDGARNVGPDLVLTRAGSAPPALATLADGRVVIAAVDGGQAHLYVLNSELTPLLNVAAQQFGALDDYTQLSLAIAGDNTVALLSAPAPSGPDFVSPWPMRLARLRLVEPAPHE